MVEREWNVELLQKLFTSWEVEAIRSIPIAPNARGDIWAWHHSKSGEFTTRSAYFLELNKMQHKGAFSSGASRWEVWNKLWKANTPMKIKNFGWRALQNGITVFANLNSRGCECDQFCPLCGEDVKTTLHRLVTCLDSQRVWKTSPLRIEVNPALKDSFKTW